MFIEENEIDIFKRILSINERQLKNVCLKYLKKNYDNVINKKNYIIAIGDVPIGLVAHLDTVYEPTNQIFYDPWHRALWNPNGLGADDRAGVFGIIKLIKNGYKPTVILTCGEEIGGVGAIDLVKDFGKSPTDLKFLIELDRQGNNECVFYKSNNKSFQKYILSKGFKMKIGSFSDISILCPVWNIAGVNLSVGYYDEHSHIEHLFLDILEDTLTVVEEILDENINKNFTFND